MENPSAVGLVVPPVLSVQAQAHPPDRLAAVGREESAPAGLNSVEGLAAVEPSLGEPVEASLVLTFLACQIPLLLILR